MCSVSTENRLPKLFGRVWHEYRIAKRRANVALRALSPRLAAEEKRVIPSVSVRLTHLTVR